MPTMALQTARRTQFATFVREAFSFYRQYGSRHVSMLELRKGIALQPDHADAHFALGVILQEDGNLNGAIREFEQALGYKPDFPTASYHLGLARQQAVQRLY